MTDSISKNFSYSEFTDSKTAVKHKIDNNIKHAHVRNNIKELVYHVLQPLRDHLGVPININSGYRCLKLNELVGGQPTSQHVMGQASDFTVEDYEPIEIARLIVELKLPYDQLGVYDSFIHVSYSSRERGQVFYDKSYKGEKL